MANQVAYGFVTLKDLFAERVADVGIPVVNAAIDKTVAEHNRQIDALIALFAQRTTDFKTRFRTPTLARNQPLDESGRARPIRLAGRYDVAYPIQMSGNAWGADYVAKTKMTVEEANAYTNTLILGDIRWMRDHILAALFGNVSWTYTDDDDNVGTLTILGPANGDTQVYLIQGGADAGATDSHFMAQAAGIADATNPYPLIYADLIEHPENGGDVVAFIPTGLVATTKALLTFFPASNPNLQPGSGVTTLARSLTVATPGKLVGYADGVWIYEWASLPAGYIVATTTDGERALRMREDKEVELQGFKKVAERNDHPFYESQWLRRAGFGAWNRVNALVYRIGNASYAIPTGYDSPMA